MLSELGVDSVVEAIMQALDCILPGLHKHGERVSSLSVETGRQLGLSEHSLKVLHFAARLHDIGILTTICANSVLSRKVLFDIEMVRGLFDPAVMTIVGAAHRGWLDQGRDGFNSRSMISLSASIVSVAELYDCAHKGLRPFPRIVPRHNLERAMIGLAGTRFDPRVIPLVLQVAREMGTYRSQTIDSRVDFKSISPDFESKRIENN